MRVTPGTNRRLRIFATIQIACSFVLLAGAGMLIATLTALQTANTGYDMRQVLAIDVPLSVSTGVADATRPALLPGSHSADRRAAGRAGCRGWFGRARGATAASATGGQFSVEGYQPADGEESPTAQLRVVSPGFFGVLGVPILSGRDFTDEDRSDTTPSPSSARAWRSACSRTPTRSIDVYGSARGTAKPRRIVGIVADVDDQNVVQEPTLTIYQPIAAG